VLLRGAVFDVVASRLEFPSGLRQELEIVEHPGAVAVAAVTDAGELVLVRQYRHAARAVLLEIPAGRLEPDEEPLAAARRELAEETGFRARVWHARGHFFPAPGFASERLHLFEARGLEHAHAHPDADEELEVVLLSPARALEVARDAKTLLAAAQLLMGR
jgi:ADP-ribose pyrophosphatase